MEVTGVGEIVQQIKVLERTLAWMLAKDNGTSPKAKSLRKVRKWPRLLVTAGKGMITGGVQAFTGEADTE